MGDSIKFELAGKMGYQELKSTPSGPEYAEGYYNYEELFKILSKGDVVSYNVDDFMFRPDFLTQLTTVVVYYKDIIPTLTINGRQRSLNLKVKANTRKGAVLSGMGFPIAIIVDPVTSTISYEFRIRYEDYQNYRGDEQYALIFSFEAYDDWVYSLSRLNHAVSGIESWIFETFNDAFIRYKNNRETLDFVYQHAPIWVIARLGQERAYHDMKLILQGIVNEYGTNEEVSVLNILKSFVTPPYIQDNFYHKKVNETFINEFYEKELPKNVNLLLTRMAEDKMDGATVFEKLYYKINDYGGEDNFTEFIQLCYALWLNSDYPNKEYLDHNPSDMVIIDYKSKKILGFYNTNFNFYFHNENLVAKKNVIDNTIGSLIQPIELPVAILHMFQPINIPEIDQSGELKIPDKVIPAFFLKAIDDKNYWNNIEKVVDIIIDVVTLFTGIGNLVKLRHLARLGQGVETIQVLLAGIEVTSSTLSIMLNLLDDCTDETFCAKLRQFLIFLDLATLGVDGLTSKYLTKSAKEAYDAMPDGLKHRFPEVKKQLQDVFEQDAKRILKADFEILPPNLLSKYINDTIVRCKRRGITLEIKWIDENHPRYYTNYMGVLQVSNNRKKIVLELRKDCPKITWYHENWHLEDFFRLGWKKYTDISKNMPWLHEESVWKSIYKNRNKWSEFELVDAYLYYKKYYVTRLQPPIIHNELEKLIPKYQNKPN
jgi:hypothetical protein